MSKENKQVILERISKNIKKFRKVLGDPSIEALSKTTKLSFQTFLNLKNNRSNSASISTLVEVANALKCNVVDLLH